MPKLARFYINFGNSVAIYSAGQNVQGYLNVEVDKPLNLQCIRVYVKGEAFVHWTDQRMRGPAPLQTPTRHHSAHEEYFDFTSTLLGNNDNNAPKITLLRGNYCYPFQFQLPQNLPSSFEGKYGHIRYTIKGTIEKPKRFSHVTKTAFSVIGPLDLNTFPQIDSPIGMTVTKNICCLCCTSGPLSAYLSLPRRGFVPGDIIPLTVEIENLSRRKIASSSITLKMTTNFHSHDESRTVSTEIDKIVHGSVPRGATSTRADQGIPLPALPPSFLFGCNIIDIQYKLELRVDAVGPSFEMYLPLEIIVGTVPLRSTMRPIPNSPRYDSRSQSHRSTSSQTSSEQYSVSLTYMESRLGGICIKEKDDPEDMKGDHHFTPIYPYYIWTE
ncbi:arrestin domain-containing protein 3-like [Ostrea edulis]|uniref:arrestin domain-containing protein 3-like n=1 Tax=Ostrea edulis TaxID=37623 RepID=UPI00209543C8|nr:arrestin domain-containing protein 3-like [Ostrea edulis]XP_056020507.1 arrestin domain-containing protein 3-like [Ostrea edulis]